MLIINYMKSQVIVIVINAMKEGYSENKYEKQVTTSGHETLHSKRVCQAKTANWKKKQPM